MGYKVIVYFEDLQDEGHPYNIGDAFPREGFKVTAERIKELSTDVNKRGVPLIEKVTEPVKKAEPADKPKRTRKAKK